MSTKKKLALFDLDGTLFNTDEVNYMAYKTALAEFSVDVERDHFLKVFRGRRYKEFIPEIMGNSEHLEEIHEKKKAVYSSFLSKSRPNTHLFNMIDAMKNEYHIAIVTTASKKNVTEILDHFGVSDVFEFAVTQEDMVRSKPDPEGFLTAMEHFGIGPEDTVIFEDSPVGIEAALASGATVFKVERF
ncbi:MAG: HAD family hydrolase [Lachnospiraceae bacterium]|nr:HAD family hydrolase [Lachnospiraceae bacterium]